MTDPSARYERQALRRAVRLECQAVCSRKRTFASSGPARWISRPSACASSATPTSATSRWATRCSSPSAPPPAITWIDVVATVIARFDGSHRPALRGHGREPPARSSPARLRGSAAAPLPRVRGSPRRRCAPPPPRGLLADRLLHLDVRRPSLRTAPASAACSRSPASSCASATSSPIASSTTRHLAGRHAGPHRGRRQPRRAAPRHLPGDPPGALVRHRRHRRPHLPRPARRGPRPRARASASTPSTPSSGSSSAAPGARSRRRCRAAPRASITPAPSAASPPASADLHAALRRSLCRGETLAERSSEVCRASPANAVTPLEA